MIRVTRDCDVDKIMTRLATKIQDIWIPFMDVLDPPVALSYGMNSGPIGIAEQIIHQADMNMYALKNKRKEQYRKS